MKTLCLILFTFSTSIFASSGDLTVTSVQIDGRAPALSTIEIREGWIVNILNSFQAKVGVKTMDGGGGIVLPGLIDAHTHQGSVNSAWHLNATE